MDMTVRILTRYSFCVLNFMLTACRPNFVEFARSTYKVEWG